MDWQLLAAVPLLIFSGGAVFAGIHDALTLKIPNMTTAFLAVLFAYYAVLIPSWEQVAVHLACGGVSLVIGFAALARGWIGGGDAKLCAVCALWLGWPLVTEFLLWTGLFGGVLALLCLLVRVCLLVRDRFALFALSVPERLLARVPDWLHKRGQGIPYGAPMGFVAAWLFVERLWLPAAGVAWR